ncbi:MAG: DUF2079 domain-containing protein [Gammaproteobacteria bacterium]|nr:DUF2079 domain-containing protein [Gammaproteobacteria bacterium]
MLDKTCIPGAGRISGNGLAWAVVVLMAASATTGWFVLNKALFDHHYLAARDLGFFTQSLWNAMEGNGLRTTIGATGDHLFGEHVYLSHWLLLPVYYAAPHPYTLLFLQSAAVSAAAVGGYAVSRALSLPRLESLLMAAALLAHPSMHGTATGQSLYGYHPDALMPALFLFAFYAYFRARRPLFWGLVFVSLITAEQYAVVWAGIAVYLYWIRERRDAVLLASLSVAWLLMGTKLVLLLTLGSDQGPWYHSALEFPEDPSRYLAALERGGLYAVKHLVLFCMLPVATLLPLALVPMVGLFVQAEAFGYTVPLGVMSWHAAAVVPVLFISSVIALVWLRRRFPARRGWVLIGLLIWVPGLLVTSLRYAYWVDVEPMPPDRRAAWSEIRGVVPGDASVSATLFAASHLTHRIDLYLFPRIADAEYVVVDRRERISLNRKQHRRLASLRDSARWMRLFDKAGFVVFRRAEVP